MDLNENTREQIQALIDENPIVLFMKGNPQAPQCGFSAKVVEILDAYVPEYETLDVLSHPEIREGIKIFSSWPTIPQLYARGEFVGGCDIITEMAGSGELFEALGVEAPPEIIPKIHITETAAEALEQAAAQSAGPGQYLRLSIDRSWKASLSVDQQSPMDAVAESGGIRILVDRLSSQRADGITIDLVDGPQGRGFKVDNPNAPIVHEMGVQQLKSLLDSGEAFEFIDVRTPSEVETARIEGAQRLDEEAYNRLMALPKNTQLVFICHHGPRGMNAAQEFLNQNFRNVHNVVGGIDAWSIEIDPTVPRY